MSTASLTVEEAAVELRVHPQTVYRLVWAGALTYKNISTGTKRRRIRIPRVAIDQYLRGERGKRGKR